jgi:hypothetical protein
MIEGGYLLPEDIEGVQKRAETLWHDIMETPGKR